MESEECHKNFTEKIENEDKPWGVAIPSWETLGLPHGFLFAPAQCLDCVLLNQTKPCTWNVHSKKCRMKMWVARPWLNVSPPLSFNKAPQSSTLDQQVPSSPLLVACHPFDTLARWDTIGYPKIAHQFNGEHDDWPDGPWTRWMWGLPQFSSCCQVNSAAWIRCPTRTFTGDKEALQNVTRPNLSFLKHRTLGARVDAANVLVLATVSL